MPSNKPGSNKSLEITGLLALVLFGAGLLVTNGRWCLYAAFVLLFTGLFLKPAADLVASFWLKLSAVLGGANSTLILTCIFYFFLTPIAFLYRKTHGDLLGRREKGGTWHLRDHEYRPSDLEETW